jgi:hypothetical protein
MKCYPSIRHVEEGIKLKAELQSLSFRFLGLGMPHYKEGCKT